MEKSALISLILELRARLGMVVILQKKIDSFKKRIDTFISERKTNELNCWAPYFWTKEDYLSLRTKEFEKQKDDAFNAFLKSHDDYFSGLFSKERKKHARWKTLNILGLILFVILFPVLSLFSFLYVFFVPDIGNSDPAFFLGLYRFLNVPWSMILALLMFLIAGVVWISFFVEIIRLFKYKFHSDVSDLYWQERLKKRKELENLHVGNCQSILNEPEMKVLTASYLKAKEECHEKFETQQKGFFSELHTMIEAKQNIYQQTQKQFSQFILEDDWKNLDLILYYLVSNRADTIKEALNLADSQTHHEELMNAIHKVGEYVTQTISRQINQLGVAFQERMDRIDQKVLSLERNFEYKLNLVADQMKMMQEQHIEAIEGLRYSVASSSIELAREAREYKDSVVSELRYISNYGR